MRFKQKQNHMVDFLFPVALFFVFTLSALTILLLATKIYRSTIEDSSLNDTARTSLAYISEKIHQNDNKDSVSVGTFDGCDALILKQTHENETYDTYIYAYNNELKELFLKEGISAEASSGKTILQIESFTIEPLSDNQIRFHCVDSNGKEASIVIGLKTEQNM